MLFVTQIHTGHKHAHLHTHTRTDILVNSFSVNDTGVHTLSTQGFIISSCINALYHYFFIHNCWGFKILIIQNPYLHII